jgi:hypothetical protein
MRRIGVAPRLIKTESRMHRRVRDSVVMHSNVLVQLVDRYGVVQDERTGHNVFTNQGRNWLTRLLTLEQSVTRPTVFGTSVWGSAELYRASHRQGPAVRSRKPLSPALRGRCWLRLRTTFDRSKFTTTCLTQNCFPRTTRSDARPYSATTTSASRRNRRTALTYRSARSHCSPHVPALQ